MKRTFIRIASTLFPGTMVNVAYKQLTNPQIRKLRVHELEVLDTAEKEVFEFMGFQIQLYRWRGGPKEILLVHGWEGQAGNFSDIIERLLKEGYTIHSFDGPSHGFSSRGETSVFQFSELVGVLIDRFNIKQVISHSFGAVATTYGLFSTPHLALDKYVLLTTPDKFSERINSVAQQVGITAKVKQLLIERLEAELNMDITTLNVSNFVKKVNVKKALIIHDKNDHVISIAQSQNVQRNWPNCELMPIEGTGHFRILRTPFGHDEVLAFLN